MKGYRTIILQVVTGVLFTAGYFAGVEFPAEYAEEITTGLVDIWAVINIFMRFKTDTPPLKSDPF